MNQLIWNARGQLSKTQEAHWGRLTTPTLGSSLTVGWTVSKNSQMKGNGWKGRTERQWFKIETSGKQDWFLRWTRAGFRNEGTSTSRDRIWLHTTSKSWSLWWSISSQHKMLDKCGIVYLLLNESGHLFYSGSSIKKYFEVLFWKLAWEIHRHKGS